MTVDCNVGGPSLALSNSSMDDSPFAPLELDAVLTVLKNKKAPGPDTCRSELVKWLSGINRLYLLEL